MTEIIEIAVTETVIIEHPGGGEILVVESSPVLEVVEAAEQGPVGPPGTAAFDDDLALAYQIAKL